MNFLDTFKNDVHTGLSSTPKSLPSKYFYDEKGDELFVRIMHMPEYYLTDSEKEIFMDQAVALAASFGMDNRQFDLIELGAGDGTKTQHLLAEMLGSHDFTYVPIDISPFAIESLTERLNQELPELKVAGRQGEYFEVLQSLGATVRPKVILFLGSNIGNLSPQRAAEFMQGLSAQMNPGDKVLLGVDLKKKADVVLPAYNDREGITREFNLNLLRRINRELDGNFDINGFDHIPEYDESRGTALSFLVSTKDQEVRIGAMDTSYSFSEGEKIHTEISQKYDRELLEQVIADTGLGITHVFQDVEQLFADFILEKR